MKSLFRDGCMCIQYRDRRCSCHGDCACHNHGDEPDKPLDKLVIDSDESFGYHKSRVIEVEFHHDHSFTVHVGQCSCHESNLTNGEMMQVVEFVNKCNTKWGKSQMKQAIVLDEYAINNIANNLVSILDSAENLATANLIIKSDLISNHLVVLSKEVRNINNVIKMEE